VIAAAHAADAAARQAAMGQVGELRISAVTSAFVDPLPAILADFQDSHPDVDIRLDEVDTHVAVQALRRGETDVALVRQLATPLDCRRVTLRRENFVLAVPRVWAEHSDQPWTLQSVADLPWIWLPRAISPDYHDQVVACCRAAGFSPQARHTARSITSQLAMVASGLGVTLVPESAARHVHDGHSATHFVTLDRPTTIELAAVWHRDENVLVDAFLASARHVS
jgi:DNA-binding transcriptional LysR family regulator